MSLVYLWSDRSKRIFIPGVNRPEELCMYTWNVLRMTSEQRYICGEIIKDSSILKRGCGKYQNLVYRMRLNPYCKRWVASIFSFVYLSKKKQKHNSIHNSKEVYSSMRYFVIIHHQLCGWDLNCDKKVVFEKHAERHVINCNIIPDVPSVQWRDAVSLKWVKWEALMNLVEVHEEESNGGRRSHVTRGGRFHGEPEGKLLRLNPTNQ